ncbi:ispH [Symbiodinium sp. CCMP2592]|nr:ispH [Symbiodinium sp. CCMP2592]
MLSGVLLVSLSLACVCYTAVLPGDAFVGPTAAPATGAGSTAGRLALRGAQSSGPAPTSAFGGSAALGASAAALLLLKAAHNVRRKDATRSPVRTIVKAEGEGRSLESLEVGEEVSGTVQRDAKIGVYVDIGAEKPALLPRNMVPKGQQYEAGDVITGLKIWQVETGDTPATRKIRVTLGELPTSFSEGQKVKGKVSTKQSYGVFFDIGGMRDALAPARSLSKRPDQYAEGEEAELEVLSIEGDKITVGIVGVAAAAAEQSAATSKALSQLKLGQDIEGTIARVNPEYGLFINIGIGIDALCTPSQLDKAIEEYKEGDKISVKVANVDVVKEQVAVTTRPLASQAKVGEKVEGTMLSESKAGIFFDAGYSRDFLAPNNLLSKPKDEYTRGEVADLTVMQVDGDRVTVSDKEDVGKPVGSFVRGQEVAGKVVRYMDSVGIFMDIGASRDALWRTKGPGATVLPKEPQEYAAGEEVSGLIVTRLDAAAQTLEVAMPGAELVATSLSMETLKVGEEVSGTVTKTIAFGVFVDIGAERDALYAISQLEKPLSDYQPGDKLEGLRVTEVDAQRQRLGVSARPVAGEYEVGQEVTGKVTKIMEFGLFVDIGASVDALAPTALLSGDTSEYTEGQVLEDLKVTRVDIPGNKIAVGQQAGAGDSEATTSIDKLEVGSKVSGVVRGIREYGIFVDIGLGRMDALMPNSMLGDVTSAAFKPNQKIEVYIAQVDAAQNRVTVSAVEPTAEMRQRRGRGSGGSTGASLDSYIPQGFMIPDPKRHAEIIGREDLMDPEPIPWYEWAEKFPGFIRFNEKDQVITISVRAHGFYGEKELRQAFPAHLPVPAHLQKADAKPATKEDFFVKLEDQPMPNYDVGIKPEIHTKYRQPPLNDPNWREFPVPDRKPITMDFKTIVERAGPFVPTEKPGLKKAKEADGDD